MSEPMNSTAPMLKPTILCVDDDEDVLEGLALSLFKTHTVLTANSGARGLAILAQHPETSVVISDMRMPEMNGAEFLAQVRSRMPDSSRILLTGYADVENAASAVNEGEIFRFLTKPCPADKLQKAVGAGVQHHQQLTAEHELLQITLKGCVEALVNVLVLSEPHVFGLASRVKSMAGQVSHLQKNAYTGEVETAALLYNLGMMGKPAELVAELIHDDPVTSMDLAKHDSVIQQTDRLLSSIPRIENIRWMIQLAHNPYWEVPGLLSAPALSPIHNGADILRTCYRFCILEQRGMSSEAALISLRDANRDRFPSQIVTQLSSIVGLEKKNAEVRSLPLRGLKRGMILAEELRNVGGQLLAPAGYVITAPFAERAASISPGTIKEPIKVIIRRLL